MKRLLIIKDFRNWFWSTYPNWTNAVSLNVKYMKDFLEQQGFQVEITSYNHFDYQKNYADYFVIYSSSEDYCGGTKNFMEDVLLHLKVQGAKLLPDFQYFRAHDNKVMMEILRYSFKTADLKSIKSQVWASMEEMLEQGQFHYPVVIKKANGAGGEGVFLAYNKKELVKYAEKVSRLTDKKMFEYLSMVNIKQKLIRQSPVKIHNTKFITQNYIKNLKGDYKVLVFGENYFVLHRLNRKNDFRASGSGNFEREEQEAVIPILDYARLCKTEIKSPWLSLDICKDEEKCYLIEFQCIFFGFKAMSLAEHYYTREGDSWVKIEGKVVPEEQFCKGLISFLAMDG